MWGAAHPALNFLQSLSWSHLIDIGIMWFLLYQVYIRFRGTQAMRLLARVFGAWLVYLASRAAGLHLTSFLLWAIWIAALILFLINFHGEIQRIFFQLNPVRRVSTLLRRAMRIRLPEESVAAVAESAFALARANLGAILVVERRDSTEALLSSPGERIDADIRPALLETIFLKGAPCHDGAAVIRGSKIARAGCLLPLSENPALPPSFGARHRAAAGVAERCDALAIVVSEERGEITCLEGGQTKRAASGEELVSWLSARLRADRGAAQAGRRMSPGRALENWKPKLAALAAVLFLWTLGGQGGRSPQTLFPGLESRAEEAFRVPLRFYNLPEGAALPADAPQAVRVRIGGRRDLLNFLDASRLRVSVNLAAMAPGARERALTGRDIDLPGGLEFLGAEPATLRFTLGKAGAKEEKREAP